ncbi:hypothetical protein FA95DRAFT_1611991 [Auriscalpium vulgare]|uniref:Uncharacterized protein n=1 Tax=Auriscalpium vulgare TaxID=40419 RepID=A0ACB8R8E4_9AGAM|nr:hypothetical protein FA95DRAFT_1611991 [Auriscalpium vulgare]
MSSSLKTEGVRDRASRDEGRRADDIDDADTPPAATTSREDLKAELEVKQLACRRTRPKTTVRRVN